VHSSSITTESICARVSTDKQADHGVSLEAQEAKIRAMATVQGAAVIELIVDGGESAKDLKRPGMDRLLTLVDERKVDTVIIAKLDRLTRSVKDLAELLERFQRRGVSLVSVAESLDTGSAAGRLVINIMTAVSQWEREAIAERTREAMSHKKSNGQRVGNIVYGYRLGPDGSHLEPDPHEQTVLTAIRDLRRAALHVARDCSGTECSRSSHAPGLGLAAGACGADRGHSQVGW
jgi:site-specific DNA recombinase